VFSESLSMGSTAVEFRRTSPAADETRALAAEIWKAAESA